MLNINSAAVAVLVTITIAYFIGCIATYVHLFASKTKPFDHDKVERIRKSPLKIFIILFSVVSLYLLSRWTIQQMVFGCTNVAFWNPTCYDLNQLNRVWLGIIGVLSINAILVSYLYDTKWNKNNTVHRDQMNTTKMGEREQITIENDSMRRRVR